MTINGYELLERIGGGRSSEVWRAHQPSLDRTVAVKLLKPELAARPEVAQTFLDGAKTASRLKHPNAVQIYDIGVHEGAPYLVMEYVSGRTLFSILEERGAVKEKKALVIAQCLADALDHAQREAGLFHGDLAPRHVMLDDQGDVKLLDLGLAPAIDPVHAAESAHSGASAPFPYYVAPERIKSAESVDFRSDMYSLGAILYHMLTGAPPFAGQAHMDVLMSHVNEQAPHPRDRAPLLSRPACYTVSRLMMKQPESRYPTWAAVVEDLEKAERKGILLKALPEGAVSSVAPPTAADTDAAFAAAARKVRAAGQSTSMPLLLHVLAWVLLALVWAYTFLVMLTYRQTGIFDARAPFDRLTSARTPSPP